MLNIPESQERQLNKLAFDAGQPVLTFLDSLINQYIQDNKDAKTAVKAYQEFIQSGEKSISLEQVLKENGL